jgi:DNA-binding CsgD family transcriptional regulator
MNLQIGKRTGIPMAIGIALPGFLLLDASLNPIAFNQEALAILAYPVRPELVKQPNAFMADKIRSTLVSPRNRSNLDFAMIYRSGNRHYTCRQFRLTCNDQGELLIRTALLLERRSSSTLAVSELGEQFDLTGRECETVAFLRLGLTSKEIATRMNISPNTVKAFLRLVMVKMDVSTRSGIVGTMLLQHDDGQKPVRVRTI